jgi:hypothetical protein
LDPQTLHQIILQLVMGICVSNFLTAGEKSSEGWRHIVINIYKIIHPFMWLSIKHWEFPLALTNHVRQYHTGNHDLLRLVFRLGKSGVPGQWQIELTGHQRPAPHPFCKLLAAEKIKLSFLQVQGLKILDICLDQIVLPLIILMTIDLELHKRSIAFNKLLKHIRALQHIDIIARSCHTEKKHAKSRDLDFCHCLKHQ